MHTSIVYSQWNTHPNLKDKLRGEQDLKQQLALREKEVSRMTKALSDGYELMGRVGVGRGVLYHGSEHEFVGLMMPYFHPAPPSCLEFCLRWRTYGKVSRTRTKALQTRTKPSRTCERRTAT